MLTSISEDNASPVAFLCSNYGIGEVYASSYANIDGMQALISEGVDVRLLTVKSLVLTRFFSRRIRRLRLSVKEFIIAYGGIEPRKTRFLDS
ncbi:MAG: hypothetical protein ACLUSP_11180 [Christensenellales bacterium]